MPGREGIKNPEKSREAGAYRLVNFTAPYEWEASAAFGFLSRRRRQPKFIFVGASRRHRCTASRDEFPSLGDGTA
jgi:hypothetical protein